MSKKDASSAASRRTWFDRTERLNRSERIVLVVVVGVIASFDLIGLVTADTDLLDRPDQIINLVTTLTLILYTGSPLVATSVLGVVVGLSLATDYPTGSIMAGSLAALLVLRLASTPLIIAYAGGLLIVTAVAASDFTESTVTPADITAYLFIATIAGGLGVGLRVALARGSRLEHRLVEQQEHEREAIKAERRWIAGELHDSIAHHLTIISLHTQLLDDAKMRPISQEAIQTASRKALSDLRFVIKLAEDMPSSEEMASGDLAAAIDEARSEFEAAGHTTVLQGNPEDETIPRGVEIILARVVRESATNVIKYAGAGQVEFRLDIAVGAITLEIRSPLSAGGPRVTSSTGTGLNRMAERVLGVSGEFSAGPEGDVWLVHVRLPIAAGNGATSSTEASPSPATA